MRIFKRKPRNCDAISFRYNFKRPEEGIQLGLGYGEDKKLPGSAKREAAYYHFGVSDLDWLIEYLKGIQAEFKNASE